MNGNFRCAVETDRYAAGAGSVRGISMHIKMFPATPAIVELTGGIGHQWIASGQADLSGMGMAAEEQVDFFQGGLFIDFRGMGKQNGHVLRRDGLQSLAQVGAVIKMIVINTAEMNFIALLFKGYRFIEQHVQAAFLQGGDKFYKIMVTQYAPAAMGRVDVLEDFMHNRKSLLVAAVGFKTVITGYNAEVGLQGLQQCTQGYRPVCNGIGMDIREMHDRETVKGGRQIADCKFMPANGVPGGIFCPAIITEAQFQAGPRS